MRVSILDHAPLARSRFANVASEVVKEGAFLYSSYGDPNLQFHLGFTGKLTGAETTFINPYWASNSSQLELLPASQNDIAVTLSEEAQRLGARVVLEFNGLSPRIKVTFPSSPVRPLTIGSAVVGFAGVWPLKGTYFCLELQTQATSFRKALEPYGTIALRTTCDRILETLVNDAVDRGLWRINATDQLSTDFIKDNLVADLCDFLLDDVGKRSVMLKTSVSLPGNLTNTYENSQDGIFTRAVSLAI